MTLKTSFFLVLILLTHHVCAQSNQRFVNPFIGTDGTGHTFPGPSMPFGMVQPSPDNRDHGWEHTSGYQYRDTVLLGFSQTHLSGTGINELGDILLLPINPTKETLKNAYFKDSEKARAGYYEVLKKDGVKVQLTCSERVAFHKYTYPERTAQLLVDLQHGLRFVFDENDPKPLVRESSVHIENSTTISGYCSTDNWVKRTYFFSISFSEPIFSHDELPKKPDDKAPRYLLNFRLNPSKVLNVKIALSTVDVQGAKNNMRSEIDHWNFDRVYQANTNAWSNYLNRIDIDAAKPQKEMFYTSFYHLLLQPSNIADVDGRYRGANGEIYSAQNLEYYSTLSNWDVYRAAFPLLQIVAPERINGIVNTMLLHHEASGFLPIWTTWGQDNYCMIGNHAIPMIVSAYQNGFTGFDPKNALRAMLETSTKSHINSDWDLYHRFGYYPYDKIDNEAVSRTLESGFDDWCVSELARKMGDTLVANMFKKRSAYYMNLFDPQTQFFRGKNSLGAWRTDFNPLIATSPLNNPGDYTEANAWQYFWTPAQHDLDGVIRLLNGSANFTEKLDAFFKTKALNPNKFLGQEAMIGQYAHGNEPSHHIIYLYAFTDRFQTGQKYIHQVINDFHQNTPYGLIGNDDCGQMSAWYILSTLGFYPVNPANGTFVLGSPQVKKARIHHNNSTDFHIEAKNYNKANIYHESPLLNGEKIKRPHITYSEIMNGGILQFQMKPQ